MGLKEVRARRGITQHQLAEQTGLSRITIARYESKAMDSTSMTVRTAITLAQALACSLDELLDLRTDVPMKPRHTTKHRKPQSKDRDSATTA